MRSPVLDVYDQYRTARLNIRYLESELQKLHRKNFGMEFTLAVSTSSGVTGLWFWQSIFGGFIWKLLGAFAVILSIVKPMLGIPKKIQRKEEMLAGYRALEHDLEKLKIIINQQQTYSRELQQKFLEALDRKGDLIKLDQDAKKDPKLLEACYQQVLKELPADEFYVPDE